MAANSDVIMLPWLPWKPIRCHVTILNWKYTGHLLHIPSFMSIGLILLKIEGGGAVIDTPPSCLRVTFFSMPSWVNHVKLGLQLKVANLQ